MLARVGVMVARVGFGFWCLLLAVARPAASQDSLPPWEGGFTFSLGQPRRLHLQAGASVGADWRQDVLHPVGLLSAGVSRSFGNPVVGALGASLEAFGGFRGVRPDAGLRALIMSPSLRLSGGVEVDARDGRIAPMLGYTMPFRRGGVFGGGSLVRLEWLPGAGMARASILAPVNEPWAGRTRPRTDEVSLPFRGGPPPVARIESSALIDALAHVRTAASRLAVLVVPFVDAPGHSPQVALAPVVAELRTPPSLPGYHADGTVGTAQVARIYHREVERAFSIAVSGQDLGFGQTTPEGEALARRARAILLEHVIYPFDRLLGQRKRGDALQTLGRYARGNWARELVGQQGLSPAREAVALEVFDRLLETLEAVRAEQMARWDDSRLLWLPLQLGLQADEYDTQAELDQVVEAAVGQPFTDGNEVWYVVNGEFQREVTSSIFAARDYHVLWIHDFRGRNTKGEPDAASLRYVTDAYLAALTRAVRAYDERRRMPVYLIFLDEHYYEANRARLWLDFLERPLGDLPKLPRGFEAYRASLGAAQDSLRRAVAESRLLQAEARQYGEAWLENVIKVQVSVTNPVDNSFWGHDIVPVIGIPDNVMRDHRKIAFYDVTEEDPYRGLAIYTGMGIGEHYAGPTWEDRAIMARGPVLATLKDQARRLLLGQGLSEDQIPYPLRSRPKPPDYDARIRRFIAEQGPGGREHDQRAMELHNLTGYQDKPINIAKATLYTLMPPGSVIETPDSIWGSAFFAALLTGSALRGCRVLIIAPSLASASASGWPSMGLAHDLIARLIVVQQQLGPELVAAGGLLKTGIYNPGLGVDDALNRFTAAYYNARRTPFLRRLFPVDPAIDSMLVHYRELLRASGATEPVRAPGVAAKLHLKANWFSSREAWDSLIGRPELEEVLAAYIAQLVGPAKDSLGARAVADALSEASRRLVESFRASQPPETRSRVMYYLTVGSANQDYRSMFMDGEAAMLLSGWSTVVSLIDFGLIANLSVWVDDLDLLDALLPPLGPFKLRVARWVRSAL